MSDHNNNSFTRNNDNGGVGRLDVETTTSEQSRGLPENKTDETTVPEPSVPVENTASPADDDVDQDQPSETDHLIQTDKAPRNYADPHTPSRLSAEENVLTAPSMRESEVGINKKISAKQKEHLIDKNVDGPIYQKTTNSLALIHQDDAYHRLLDQMEEPLQLKDYEGMKIGIKKLAYTPPENPEDLTDEAWERYSRSIMSLGERDRCDLVHSLFSVRVGDFDTDELLSLITQLNMVRSDIGTRTQGLILSTEDAHIVTMIVDHILEHVSACTIKGWTIETIRDNLRIQDIPRLMAAALDSIYPDGYPFIRECTNTLEFEEDGTPKCDFSTLEEAERLTHGLKLHFRRVLVTDDRRFDDRCWGHLSAPWDSLDVEKVQEAQDHLWNINNDFRGWKRDGLLGPFNSKGSGLIYLRIKPPVYSRYRNEGIQWVNEVVSMVESRLDAMEDEDDESSVDIEEVRAKRRIEYQNMQISLLEAQRWWPWVEEIVFKTAGGKEVKQVDRNKIRITLKSLSSTFKSREQVKDAMDKNYQYMFYSYPALAQYDCPRCGSPQKDADPYSGLIPLNLTMCFFVIAALTIRRYS